MADLRAELQKAQYQGLTDQQCADLLNTRNQDGPVPCADVVRYLMGAGKWTGVKSSDFADALRILPAVEVSDQAWFAAQINALVTASALSSADRTALFAMPKNRRTLGESLGFGFVKPGHVHDARA